MEDTAAITETGVEVLTSAAPLELDDVEAVMRGRGIIAAVSSAHLRALSG